MAGFLFLVATHSRFLPRPERSEAQRLAVVEKVVKRDEALIFAQVIENVAKINAETMSLLIYAICYN